VWSLIEATSMIHMLGHYLNKVVLVSIPSIFGDDTSRACKLTGIEPSGLWLESEDFAKALLHPDDKRAAPHVFIPFHQIAFLLEPAPDLHGQPADSRKTEAPVIEHKRPGGHAPKKKHPPG
jgi:hypothetical protein